MDDLLLEDEIKIEYNESFETDPLSNKNVSSLQDNNVEIEPASDEDEDTYFNIKSSESVQDDFILNNDFNACNYYVENVPEATWYESIDVTGRLLCKFCELKYSTLQSLRYHVKTKHPNEAAQIKRNIIQSKRKSKLKCQICKQHFKEIASLKTHLHNNHSLENIKTSCLYCDATFTTENETTEHLRVQHNKSVRKTTYMCNICGYRTSIKSHYFQHKNTHSSKDKINKCRYCEYATNYLPNLKIHERIHTNDKVYACDYETCEYRCSAKSALRSHQLKHYPEQNVLYCDKCSYKTIYRQSLKRHTDCHKRNSVRLKLA